MATYRHRDGHTETREIPAARLYSVPWSGSTLAADDGDTCVCVPFGGVLTLSACDGAA